VSSLSGPARASEVPFLFFPSMSSLIPRRCYITACSLFSACGLDFAHKIEARPPQLPLYRGYQCVHAMLQPGRLRCTLSGYVVESLSMKPFPASHRLLATWLPESHHGRDLEAERPRLRTRQEQDQFTLALISSTGAFGWP
jgi:hypothetical protein